MNYSNLYELRPRIEGIYSKIETLQSYGFDTKSYLEEIKMFSSKLDQIKEENNSMIGSSTYQAEDDKLINDLSTLISNFETFIDKLLLSSKLLGNHKEITEKLNTELSDEEFNQIVSRILNSLLDINELKKYGFKFNSSSKDLFKTIYVAIKREYQLKGTSSIHNTLINMGLSDLIFNYMSQDTNTSRKKLDDSLVSKDAEIEYMFNISMNDNNYKEKIYRQKEEIEKQKALYKGKIDNCISQKESKNGDISDFKHNIIICRRDCIPRILSLLLSASVLAGGITFAVHKGKPKTTTYYRTDKACYDTIDGSYNASTFSENVENPKVLKVYSEVNEKGERTIKVYALNGESENPEDYINYEVSDDDLIDTQKVYKNDVITSKSANEYSVVEITTNVDTEDFIEQTGSKWEIILYSLIVLVLYTVCEGALYQISDGGLGAFAFFLEEGVTDSIDDIGDIFSSKREIRTLIKEKMKYDKEAKEYKEFFEKYERLDQELEEKYKLLFKKNDKKLELK